MDENKVTLSGRDPEPKTEGIGAPAHIDPETGMHKDYWVLSKEERAKGFVRPIRESYIHKTCGIKTTMALALAETYARQPDFYGATFCASCCKHFPVSEFLWAGTNDMVGS